MDHLDHYFCRAIVPGYHTIHTRTGYGLHNLPGKSTGYRVQVPGTAYCTHKKGENLHLKLKNADAERRSLGRAWTSCESGTLRGLRMRLFESFRAHRMANTTLACVCQEPLGSKREPTAAVRDAPFPHCTSAPRRQGSSRPTVYSDKHSRSNLND